jgi:hypothetical protein
MQVFSITRQWIQTYEHPFKSSLLSNVKIPPFPPNTQHKKQRIAVKQEESAQRYSGITITILNGSW